MINVEQVKRDVVNYGTLKVYTTFLTISEDEVDPELFNTSQLKEIFNSRFDTVKINIDFVEMQEGKWVSVAKELLVFKLSKCSDNEISYMSNVDDEGKLSSLVLTKSGDEVSLEVVEYSIGSGTKLYKHVIEDTNNARLTIISTSNTELTDSNILTKFNSGEFVSNSCLLEVFAGSWGTFDSAIICKSIVDGSMKFGYRGVGTLSSFTAFTIASDFVTEL